MIDCYLNSLLVVKIDIFIDGFKMQTANQAPVSDEIDLFEVFQTLWDGKWLISAFVAIAVLLGGAFLLSKDAVYESKLIYSVDTLPPFYEAKKGSKDF